jgi:transcriptional regulator with PAS, ATPase and Fis domain
VTLNPAFAEALERVKRLVDTDLSLLVLGESGTGKERLARAVHEASSRAKGPFFAINCSAIPDSLIESELFGHQKGAFTGTSASRDGAFRSADGGTLLLDEVGDAPVHVQLALLRAVEGRRVKPVGADKEFPVNVRVIAATSRDLTKLIDEQSFRSDLYFRLAEIEITLPPLRDRNVDVPQIASAILREIGCDRPLTQDAAAWLQQQPWPGNIRELRNALRRATFANPESSVIDAACFGSREVRSTDRDGVAVAINIEFSEQIRQIAEHLWHERSWPALPELSAYERRALQRAALLCLTSMHGRAAFPKALNTVWGSLFGERWASSENERGLRDLLRVLGYSGSDENARAMVLAAVG